MGNRMFDPFGSMNNMLGQLQQFVGNPVQYMIQKKMNIPQNIQNNPQEIQQYLLNSGQVTQDQMNWAQNVAKQIQKHPAFRQRFGGQNS